MKLKILLQVTVLLLLSVCVTQAANTLTVIGRHPFYKPPLKSVNDLRNMMQTQQDDIMQGLQKAGHPELYEPFMQQFAQAQISNVEYQKGQSFKWMLFKPNGTGPVRAGKDIIWGGKAPLSGYEFFIDSGEKRYTFAVPLFCGNLALKDVVQIIVKTVPGPAVPGPVVTKTVIERVEVPGPPVIKTVVERVEVPGPVVTKTVVERVEVPGPVVTKTVVERVEVPGPPVIKTVVERVEVPRCCPTCKYPIRFVADMGYFRQSDPADYGFGRLGVEYAINPNLSFLAMMGGASKVDGTDGEDAFLIDFLFQYNMFFLQVGDVWAPVFVGFGLGNWMTSGHDDLSTEDSDVDIIAQIGAHIAGRPESFNTSLFFEARSAIDETDTLSEYGRFGAGLRFRF